jgi:hypothetical protein
VDQGAGVQEFKGRNQPQHVGIDFVVALGDRPPAPVGERGPHALAAAKDEFLQRRGQFAELGTHVAAFAAALCEVRPQLIGDGAGQLDG